MKQGLLLLTLVLASVVSSKAAVGDPSGFYWRGTLDGNRDHTNDLVFEFKETSVYGLYVLDADNYNVATDDDYNANGVYNGVAQSGKFKLDNNGNLIDAFYIYIKGAYVGLGASTTTTTADDGTTTTTNNKVAKGTWYQAVTDQTPENINFAESITNTTCDRIFLFYSSYGTAGPQLLFTDRSVAEVETEAQTKFADAIEIPTTTKTNFVIARKDGSDLITNEWRFSETGTKDVYEIVGQFNLDQQFKITYWDDKNGNGTYDNDEAWSEMNLGRDIKGATGKNETVDRKYGNNPRDIEVGNPFALVSGNDPLWINDGEDSNGTPENLTFKKAIFVYDPVFPSLYLTNDPAYSWVEGTLSEAHLCADEVMGGNGEGWSNVNGGANSFIRTKFPQVYEYTELITFNNPGVVNDAGTTWKVWPSRLQIKIFEGNDPDHVILGIINENVLDVKEEYKIGLNEPFTMHTFTPNRDDAYYYGNDVHTELPFTFHRAFLYYNGYGDTAPVLYLVSDPNFSARPLDVLYEGFPVNLFMRGDDFNQNNTGTPARHMYQFYTTDQPNIYELNHKNDMKNGNLMQNGIYEFDSTFRVGGKEITEPWRVELGDVKNPTTRIELSTEGNTKTYALQNNSGKTDNFTEVTPAIDEGESDFVVYRTVLHYDGGTTPMLTIYGYQNNEEINDNPIVFGRSKYGLKVWEAGDYSTASWDHSGGLYDCIEKNADDPTFMQEYIYDMTDDSDTAQKMIMFYGPMNWDEAGDAKMTAEREGANVYVIDFTKAYPNGIPVTVPSEATNGDVSIPQHIASGVRFALYNYNYVPQSATDVMNMRKYVKYGHAFRLNEELRPLRGKLTNGVWAETNGVKWASDGTYSTTDSENWNNGETSTATMTMSNQKIGDNRLLTEYNFYLKRIILEVVNDGKDETEQLFIRFEGRYDLGGKIESERAYYYNTPETGDNKNGVAEKSNIVIGTKYVGRDRAFNRYHSNTDRNLLGGISDSELNTLTSYGIYPNLTDGYSATTTYTLKDESGNAIDAFGQTCNYEFKIPVTAAAARATSDTRVVEDTDIDDANPTYGTATRYMSDIAGSTYENTYYFDPELDGVPTNYSVSTVYKFTNEKGEQAAYVGTGTFDNSDNFEFTPEIAAEAKMRGTGDYEGWYNSTLTITPSLLTDNNGRTLPVSRYTITQQDTGVDVVVDAVSYDNANNDTYTTNWDTEVVHDADNKDTQTTLDNVWITYTTGANNTVTTQKLQEGVTESVTIQYDLKQHYTFVYPQGFYNEAEIVAADILGASEGGTASNGVVYKLKDVASTATTTATFGLRDTKIGTTGIDSVGYGSAAVTVEGNAIVITGTDAEAAIYTTTGQRVYVGSSRRIEVEDGIYIVNVSGTTNKVAVL